MADKNWRPTDDLGDIHIPRKRPCPEIESAINEMMQEGSGTKKEVHGSELKIHQMESSILTSNSCLEIENQDSETKVFQAKEDMAERSETVKESINSAHIDHSKINKKKSKIKDEKDLDMILEKVVKCDKLEKKEDKRKTKIKELKKVLKDKEEKEKDDKEIISMLKNRFTKVTDHNKILRNEIKSSKTIIENLEHELHLRGEELSYAANTREDLEEKLKISDKTVEDLEDKITAKDGIIAEYKENVDELKREIRCNKKELDSKNEEIARLKLDEMNCRCEIAELEHQLSSSTKILTDLTKATDNLIESYKGLVVRYNLPEAQVKLPSDDDNKSEKGGDSNYILPQAQAVKAVTDQRGVKRDRADISDNMDTKRSRHSNETMGIAANKVQTSASIDEEETVIDKYDKAKIEVNSKVKTANGAMTSAPVDANSSKGSQARTANEEDTVATFHESVTMNDNSDKASSQESRANSTFNRETTVQIDDLKINTYDSNEATIEANSSKESEAKTTNIVEHSVKVVNSNTVAGDSKMTSSRARIQSDFRFVCYDCGQGFSAKKKFRLHKKTEHPNLIDVRIAAWLQQLEDSTHKSTAAVQHNNTAAVQKDVTSAAAVHQDATLAAVHEEATVHVKPNSTIALSASVYNSNNVINCNKAKVEAKSSMGAEAKPANIVDNSVDLNTVAGDRTMAKNEASIKRAVQFLCSICGRGYLNPRSFRRHRKYHRDQDEANVASGTVVRHDTSAALPEETLAALHKETSAATQQEATATVQQEITTAKTVQLLTTTVNTLQEDSPGAEDLQQETTVAARSQQDTTALPQQDHTAADRAAYSPDTTASVDQYTTATFQLRRFSCATCGKEFVHRGHLSRHEKKVHLYYEGQKTFSTNSLKAVAVKAAADTSTSSTLSTASCHTRMWLS